MIRLKHPSPVYHPLVKFPYLATIDDELGIRPDLKGSLDNGGRNVTSVLAS
jgi:hypothetical protein